MLCSRILLAFDGSDLGKKALNQAIEMAKQNQLIDLDVVHVVSIPVVVVGEFVASEESLREATIQQAKELLNEIKEDLSALPNKVNTFIKEGQPAEVLLEHAREYSCDLIVMGSRGLSGIKEFFLGSVSHNVVQHARVPVLVVK